jgi:hypothetical protein
MDCNVYCLVDATGRVYVKDGAGSHAEVATNFGLNADLCNAYRFDLEPLLRAGRDYHRACWAAWKTLFADPRHRTRAWMH